MIRIFSLVIMFLFLFSFQVVATTRLVVYAEQVATVYWDYNVEPEPDLAGFYVWCDGVLAANVTDIQARQVDITDSVCSDGNNSITVSAYDIYGEEGRESVEKAKWFHNKPPNGIPSNVRIKPK